MPMTDELFDASEQFRLVRFQVANWGTFTGIHDIEISAKGHLFVGGSGSGKSTLLDAMSVLLTPGHINFNAAAREGEKRSDRSLMSYIRGAWTTLQEEDGTTSVRYLRTKSTWSSVALTYKSNLNRVVSLVFVGYVRGATTDESSVNRQYMIIPSAFSIKDISDFAEVDYNVRLIKKRFPTIEGFPSFSPYCERMRAFFNIKEETVLKLLNKAQSAKNLGDINGFFREYMLDKPSTFALADTLVEEFTELKAAYDLVKKARQQVEVLTKAKKAFDEKERADKDHAHLVEAINYVETWRRYEELALVTSALPQAQKNVSNKSAQKYDLEQAITSLDTEIKDDERALFESGGGQLESLKKEIDGLKAQKERVRRRLESITPHIAKLQEVAPQNAVQWSELLVRLNEKKESLQLDTEKTMEDRNTLIVSLSKAGDMFKSLCHDIESMKRHASNVPSSLLELRETLCETLHIEEKAIPFAGELMQIREEEKQWQGACERVLSSFTRSMLVSERHYALVAHYINETHLGTKLLYNRVPNTTENVGDLSPDTVPGKFDLREGQFHRWMQGELKRHFNYTCVDGTEQFGLYEKAVTCAGQIKHNAVRHEKDDRRRVNDPKGWFTGFSNEEKRRALEKDAQKIADEIEKEKKKIDTIDEKLKTSSSLLRSVDTLKNQLWEDLDINTVLVNLAQKEKQYSALASHREDLDAMQKRIEAKRLSLKDKKLEQEKILQELGAFKSILSELEVREKSLKNEIGDVPRIKALDNELSGLSREITKEPLTRITLPSIANRMSSLLNSRANHIQNVANLALGQVTTEFREFKRLWPTEAADLDDSFASASEYFQKLEQLEVDGLPKYENRFLELLRQQAQQKIIDLGNEIRDESRAIKSRLALVNESLSQVAFNRTVDSQTHLKIHVKDRHLEEVSVFWKLQNNIIQDSIENDKELAEKQFEKIHQLITLLDSTQIQNRLWRMRVLDVREHVEFKGIELDETGETLEVYNSGAGKSGGQRQKLTITCLAAALRYQLGGTRIAQPMYAPVVLDEAFDKADSDFTDISMKIFQEFGFQLIIATPEKGVYTLEPYVGATTYVQCRDRRVSSVTPIRYFEETGTFDMGSQTPEDRT